MIWKLKLPLPSWPNWIANPMDVFRPYILIDTNWDAYFEANAVKSTRSKRDSVHELINRIVLNSLRSYPDEWDVSSSISLYFFNHKELGVSLILDGESYTIYKYKGFVLLDDYTPDMESEMINIIGHSKLILKRP